MSRVSFHVTNWSAWPASPDQAAVTPAAPVPLLLRRRVSPLGQQALKSAWSLPGAASTRLIFASRHGEFGRTLAILDSLVAGTEVSPADFTLSVHNALAGLLSIAQHNREGHTTICAGADSFGMAMLEAAACLVERPADPVVVVYFDEPLLPPFDAFDPDAPEPIALAMTLASAGGDGFTLGTQPADHAAAAQSSALAFLRLLRGLDDRATVTGDHLTWHWRRDAASH